MINVYLLAHSCKASFAKPIILPKADLNYKLFQQRVLLHLIECSYYAYNITTSGLIKYSLIAEFSSVN